MRACIITIICIVISFGTYAQKMPIQPKWSDDITPAQKAAVKRILNTMTRVKGGTAYIGKPNHKEPSDTVYDTYRQVTVSSFAIGVHPVLQKEYDVIMKIDMEEPNAGLSLTGQSWYNCYKFIEELNRLSGLTFRMPTEAEWEYAAGKVKDFISEDYCVAELVLDNYQPHPSNIPQVNPLFYDGGAMHTVKNWGGSVEENRDRPYQRGGVNAGFGFGLGGFRLAIGDGVTTPSIEYPNPEAVNVYSNEIDTTLIKGVADTEKTQFVRGEQWDTVLEYAKSQDKLIFVDCYTKWCGPCKTMDKYVFPTKEMGKFMNTRFICAKIDMETTDGKILNKQFKVSSYPTFLILTPDGKVLERFSGLHNVRNTIQKCDSLLSLHPEYDWALARNPEPEGIDSTDYVSGRETMVCYLSFKDALSKAKEEGKRLVMLDCSTSWCGHCKIVEKRIFPLASVGDLLNRECIVNYMDMDTPEGIALRDKYDIKGYPEFMFFDLEGNLVGRVNGSGSAKVLKRRWKQAMNGIIPSYY